MTGEGNHEIDRHVEERAEDGFNTMNKKSDDDKSGEKKLSEHRPHEASISTAFSFDLEKKKRYGSSWPHR